ncbi:MAG: NAD-dependent malic enzyme [Desulfotalea sp.]|nr:MAG: NAD-dependent malic enzyme [Desulfotalea sp.]
MSSNLYRFKYDEYGNTKEIIVYASGDSARSNRYINKGTAFSDDERKALGLEATLPPGVRCLFDQIQSSQKKVTEKVDDIEKYIFLRALFNRNATLAHALVKSDIETYIKLIYTPTVGLAVQQYSSMFRQANGLHFYPGNIDNAEDILRRFASRDIRVAVVTDNHGILGLGDQGAGGIAVCHGKLMIYTQGAGIAPWHCLPISLDVGTNNEVLLADKQYLGWRQHRLEGEEYLSFIGRFVRAFRNVFPNALCQWEDFSPKNAFSIHDAFRDEIISFNDDIQGMGAVAASAIFSAMKVKKEKIVDQYFLVHGSGTGGIGIARIINDILVAEGLSQEEAVEHIFVIARDGLVSTEGEYQFYKKPYAKNPVDHPWLTKLDRTDIHSIIREAGITVLIGTTGHEFFFNEESVAEIKKNTDRPVILPLFQHVSTSAQLCQSIAKWSSEGLLIGTGNPCATMDALERSSGISQCNNAFIFPGVALGVLASGAAEITQDFFIVAAKAVSDMLTEQQLAEGRIMPSIGSIGEVAKAVALAVAMCAVKNGVSRPCIYSDFQPNGDEARMAKLIDRMRWMPEYVPLTPM